MKYARIYKLKIALHNTHPPIWRRLLVPSDLTLADLHAVFQIAMGWTNSHLHEFIINGNRYGEPFEEDEFDMLDEKKVVLHRVVNQPKMSFKYEYDFGDSWDHRILLEEILPPNPEALFPICVAGRRACPPEDSGGIYGFYNYMEIIQDPEDEEYSEIKMWLGEEYDPAAFDIHAVNNELKRYKTYNLENDF